MTKNPYLDQARDWPAGTADKMNEWAESQLGFSLEPWQMDRLRQWEAPKPRTLADMTAAEQEACRWMQAKVFHSASTMACVVDPGVFRSTILFQDGAASNVDNGQITPLPDLPRMVWPDEQA